MAGNSVVPRTIQDKISWYEFHNPIWNAAATSIGTTTTAVGALETLTTAARAAWNARETARAAAESATNDLRMAVDAMGIAGADIIKAIRTKAATAGDSVYSLASIPVPSAPAPRPAPDAPDTFKVLLLANGALQISWKCNTHGTGGVLYQVFRRIGDNTTDFIYLGGVGARTYIDETVPKGTSQITYQIQGVRSSAIGPWATFNVNFGMTDAGVVTATVGPMMKAA